MCQAPRVPLASQPKSWRAAHLVAGTCHSKHEKSRCSRGIAIPLGNWKLNEPPAGSKTAGDLGAFAEIQVHLGPGAFVGSPMGPRGEFCRADGTSFLPFFIDGAGNSSIWGPWTLQ